MSVTYTKIPSMTRQHYTFLAEMLGPMVAFPSQLPAIADELEKTNPKFNRERFIARATTAWEANHIPKEIDDAIPY